MVYNLFFCKLLVIWLNFLVFGHDFCIYIHKDILVCSFLVISLLSFGFRVFAVAQLLSCV